jgi:F420-non-reducing hydrogenase large subunit
MKRVDIDPITRLEGHGKISLFLNEDGSLANAYFMVPELRGFEQFCVGRPVEEMPLLTARICGVCPEAHHIAGAKAADAVYGVEPPSAAKKLRELFYSVFYATDHTTHFYALGGPDFVVGPTAPKAERNILGVVAKVGLEIGGEVIKMRSRGHEFIALMGGKPIHPVCAVPGGISKGLTKDDDFARAKEIVDETVEFAKFTFKLFHDIVLANQEYVDLILSDGYKQESYSMGLVDENNQVNFYDGKVRVVAPDGSEHCKYAPNEYTEYVAERVEPWSYLKFPYLKKVGWKGFVDGMDSGVYRATPQSRLNASEGMPTPLAQEEYERMVETLGGSPIHYTLACHWARVIELMYAAERAQELIADEEIRSDKLRNIPTQKPNEGVAIVEAPRGTLTHHYKCDEKGRIEKANLIVGTTNNNASIAMAIKKAAGQVIKPGEKLTDGVLNMIEMAFRSYDPCLGCATHLLGGRKTIEVSLHNSVGELLDRQIR